MPDSSKKKTASASASRKTAPAKKTASAAPAKHTASPARQTNTYHADNGKKPIRREVGGGVCFLLGLYCFLGLFNVEGLFISLCRCMKGLIGYGYYLLPFAFFIAAGILLFHRGRPVALRVTLILLIPLLFGVLADSLFGKVEYSAFGSFIRQLYKTGMDMHCGGAVAGLLSFCFVKLFSIYGTVPVLVLGIVVFAMAAFRVSPQKIAEKAKNRPHLEYEPEPEYPAVPAGTSAGKTALFAGKKKNVIDVADVTDAPVPNAAPARSAEAAPETPLETKKAGGFFNPRPNVKTPDKAALPEVEPSAVKQEKAAKVRNLTPEDPTPLVRKPEREAAPRTERAASAPRDITENVAPLSMEEAAKIAGVDITAPIASAAPAGPAPVSAVPVSSSVPAAPAVHKTAASAEDLLDDEEKEKITEEITKEIEAVSETKAKEYSYPPVSLLSPPKVSVKSANDEIRTNKERLQATLNSFGVSANIVNTISGPTITRYDLELEAGVKLTKLTNLADDLALSLGVSSVRIAPIPEKQSTVGIEVPNKSRGVVSLREIIDSDNFRTASSRLTFAIGKDISGNCICGNISKLPHMLIAGTTGSGKSVCMNSLILSLLYKSTPDEVRLIMVDPKMVELGIYNGIPHLYIPVVTDPKKAAGALQWAVVEMLKRYRLFSEAGVRDLAGFNKVRETMGEPKLPNVVIVIDELADLMLVAAKEVEDSICRVAQMGRASGMHLVIATQRPSADVITGLMKANIPSRIAFSVSSSLESRIILDQVGAEKLIGNGDMLYSPIGSGKPLRIQGAFVSDEEREEVVNFIKNNSEANYSDEIKAAIESSEIAKPAEAKQEASAAPAAEKDSNNPLADYDELLPDAADVIFDCKQASVSMLQRRLKLGYARAARIVDQLEEIGVLGPFEGSKPRQILLTREQWQQMISPDGNAGEKLGVVDDFSGGKLPEEDAAPEEGQDE